MTWLAEILAVSAVLTVLAAPVVRRAMLGLGVMDLPNHRSSHVIPTPRGGGLACAVGMAAAVIVAVATGRVVSWPALLGAAVLGVVGFMDDRRPLGPKPRLLIQLATGAVGGLLIGGPVLAGVGLVLVPLVVNVVNFMDGINGISGMTMGVWGLAGLVSGSVAGAPGFAVLAALVLGAALGFLPWNVPSARLFLGDVGSYLFGGLVALAILVGLVEGVTAWAALAPLTIYLTDVFSTLLRRWWVGSRLTEAHREHVYQRLVSEGQLPHWASSVIVAALSALSALLWIAINPVLAGLGTVVIIALYINAIRILTALRARTAPPVAAR